MRWAGNAHKKRSVVGGGGTPQILAQYGVPLAQWADVEGAVSKVPPLPTVIHGWMCLCVSQLIVELMSVEQEPAGAGAGPLAGREQ